MRGLPFRMGANLYALRLLDLQEVIPLALLRPVPGMAPSVQGLLDLHGSMLPVVDFAHFASGRSEAVNLSSRILILKTELPGPASQSLVGLIVNTTGQIVDVHEDAIQPPGMVNASLSFLAGTSAWQGQTLQWVERAPLEAALRQLLRPTPQAAGAAHV